MDALVQSWASVKPADRKIKVATLAQGRGTPNGLIRMAVAQFFYGGASTSLPVLPRQPLPYLTSHFCNAVFRPGESSLR